MEDRIQKAVELFKSGYNCSQSVVAAFADMYGFTQEQALRMSASFGGGIGRMRETCGAACGMFLVAGLETGPEKRSLDSFFLVLFLSYQDERKRIFSKLFSKHRIPSRKSDRLLFQHLESFFRCIFRFYY